MSFTDECSNQWPNDYYSEVIYCIRDIWSEGYLFIYFRNEACLFLLVLYSLAGCMSAMRRCTNLPGANNNAIKAWGLVIDTRFLVPPKKTGRLCRLAAQANFMFLVKVTYFILFKKCHWRAILYYMKTFFVCIILERYETSLYNACGSVDNASVSVMLVQSWLQQNSHISMCPCSRPLSETLKPWLCGHGCSLLPSLVWPTRLSWRARWGRWTENFPTGIHKVSLLLNASSLILFSDPLAKYSTATLITAIFCVYQLFLIEREHSPELQVLADARESLQTHKCGHRTHNHEDETTMLPTDPAPEHHSICSSV